MEPGGAQELRLLGLRRAKVPHTVTEPEDRQLQRTCDGRGPRHRIQGGSQQGAQEPSRGVLRAISDHTRTRDGRTKWLAYAPNTLLDTIQIDGHLRNNTVSVHS